MDLGNGSAKYFKFRELNGSNYNVVGIDDIPYDFYSLIPEPYKMAYQEIWRSRLWIGGKVPGIHNYLLCSNFGGTICSLFSNRIVGENGKFDGNNKEAIDYMEEYAIDDDFKNKISQLAYLMSGTGQSIMKLDVINKRTKQGRKLRYSVSVLGGDRFFVKKVGNEIEKIDIFTNFYQDIGKDANDPGSQYFLIETREYDEDDTPIGYYRIVENRSVFTEGAYALNRYEYNYKNILENKEVVKSICDKLGIEPSELLKKRKLPFKLGLGVGMVKNSYIHPRFTTLNVGCSDISKVSEDLLVTYELYTSLLSNEGSVTIPLVMLPKRLYNPNIDRGAQFVPLDNRFTPQTQGAVEGQQGYAVINNSRRQIDGTYITYVESEDPENQEPKLVQFNMRMEDIDKGIQRTLLYIANNLEISPMIFDTRLRGSSQYKNKNEIDMDSHLTENTVKKKRDMIIDVVNMVVDEILLQAGFEEKDCDYIFDNIENMSERELTEVTIMQLGSGLISKEYALKRLHHSLSKEELENMEKEIDKDAAKKLEDKIKELKEVGKVNAENNPNSVDLKDKPSNDDKLGKRMEQYEKGKVGNATVNTNVDYSSNK